MTNQEKAKLQKEIVQVLEPNPHGRLLLAPRSGKTKVVIDVIKRDKPLKILWVTLSKKLATEDIPEEFVKWKAKKYLKGLKTTTWMSLGKTIGYFDIIILDEDQHLTIRNAENLLNGSLSGNILSMTGVSSEHEEKKTIYKQLGLKTLFQISINKAVDIGLLANYKLNVLQVKMSNVKDITAGNKTKRFLTSESAQYSYLTKAMNKSLIEKKKDAKFKVLNRLRAIKNSKSKLKATQFLMKMCVGRKIIFSSGIEQSKILSKYLYNSKTDDTHLKQFQSGEIDEIVMVNTGGTGFTYKALDYFIINQIDSDKNGLTSQKITRTLLQQPDYQASIWMICLMGTQDEVWIKSALKKFDESKVEYITYENLIKENNGDKSTS